MPVGIIRILSLYAIAVAMVSVDWYTIVFLKTNKRAIKNSLIFEL